MEHEISILASHVGNVFTTGEAARAGIHRTALTRAVATGVVHRIGRGTYTLPAQPAVMPDAVYRLAVVGALRRRRNRRREAAVSGAAAALWGLPLYDVPFGRIDVAGDTQYLRRHGRLWLRPWPGGSDRCEVDGVGVVDVASACVTTAADNGLSAGLTAMDAAQHRGLVGAADLDQAVQRLASLDGISIARACLPLTDANCESVGETRTRMILQRNDFDFLSQVWIDDSAGSVGRVDFLVGGRVVIEFDGAQKYAGLDGKEALVAEKRREDRLRALGYRVVRLTWPDLEDAAAVVARIRAELAASR